MDKHSILICEKTNEFTNFLKEKFIDQNIVKVENISDISNKIEQNIFSLLVLNEKSTNISIDLLKLINKKSPITRRLLICDELKGDKLLNLINSNLVHSIFEMKKSRSELVDLIKDLLKEYTFLEKHSGILFQKNGEYDRQSIAIADKFVDFAMQLTEFDKIEKFTNHFVLILEGLKSLVRLNVNIYFKNNDSTSYDNIFRYLSDIEVFANQYDQKIIILYLNLLRAALELDQDNLETAVKYYKTCIRTFYWLSPELVDDELIDIINLFPVFDDDIYYHKKKDTDFKLDIEDRVQNRENIRALLNMELNTLVNISNQLIEPLGRDYQPLEQLLVLRNSLPIYVKDLTNNEIDYSLISGFVEALTNFIQEVTKSSGDLRNISYDDGVILIYSIKEWKYIILANNDDAYLRVGLRQYALETISIAESIPPNEYIDDDKEKKMEKIFNKIFEF